MGKFGFEILPNTADVRLRVWGKKLEELFRAALRGVTSYLKPQALSLKKRELTERCEVAIDAVDIHSLLIEFLSNIVARSASENAIFPEIRFKEFGENFLKGELWGAKVDGFASDIKAVSYQEVDIKKNPETGFYETVLVFEV